MPIITLPHEIKLMIAEQYIKDLIEQIGNPTQGEWVLLEQGRFVRFRKKKRIQLVLDGIINLIHALPELREDICRFLLRLRDAQRQTCTDWLHRARAEWTTRRVYTLLEFWAERLEYLSLKVRYHVLLYVCVTVFPGWPRYVAVTQRYTTLMVECLSSSRQIEVARGRRRASI